MLAPLPALAVACAVGAGSLLLEEPVIGAPPMSLVLAYSAPVLVALCVGCVLAGIVVTETVIATFGMSKRSLGCAGLVVAVLVGAAASGAANPVSPADFLASFFRSLLISSVLVSSVLVTWWRVSRVSRCKENDG